MAKTRSSVLDRDILRQYQLRFPLDAGTPDWQELSRAYQIIHQLRERHPVPGDQRRGDPYSIVEYQQAQTLF